MQRYIFGGPNEPPCGVPSRVCHMILYTLERRRDKRDFFSRRGKKFSLERASFANDLSLISPLLLLRAMWKWSHSHALVTR